MESKTTYKHHKFNLSIYLPFTSCKFQEYLAYRANVFMFLIGDLLKILCMYFLWKAIFVASGQDMLKGFSLPDMITYLLLSISTASCIPMDTGQIVTEIKNGSIVMTLIKPISYRLKTYFTSLGDTIYTIIFLMLPCLVASFVINYIYGNISVYTVSGTVFFILSFCFSMYINMCLNFLLGCMTFVTLNIWGVLQIYKAVNQLLSGVLIPLAFFPEWAKAIINYLPFASIISTPINIFLGKYTGMVMVQAILVQIGWMLILHICTEITWRSVVKRLVVQGG